MGCDFLGIYEKIFWAHMGWFLWHISVIRVICSQSLCLFPNYLSGLYKQGEDLRWVSEFINLSKSCKSARRTISQLNLLARGQQYELRARAKWNLYLILCCCLVWMCSPPAYTSSGYWQGGLKIPQDWRMHARVKGGYPPTCAGPLMWKQVKVERGEWCKIQGIVQMKSWPDPPLSSSKSSAQQLWAFPKYWTLQCKINFNW